MAETEPTIEEQEEEFAPQPGSPEPTQSVINPDGTVNVTEAQKQLGELEKTALEIQRQVQQLSKNETTPESDIFGDSSEAVSDEEDLRSMIPSASVDDEASKRMMDLLTEQEKLFEQRRDAEIQRINQQFAETQRRVEAGQERETGAFATQLQRMGGFLGESASATGAMLNLAQTHRNELTALEGKRQSAIREAQNAFDDRSFELARLKIQEAKELENTINQRQQQYFDNLLKIQDEERRQNQDFRDGIERDLELFIQLDEASLANMDPARIKNVEDFYGVPGLVGSIREMEKEAQKAKSEQEDIKFEMDVIRLLTQIPEDTAVIIGGQRYVGLKKLPTQTTSVRGLTAIRAEMAGLPDSLIGMDEKDIVLSLEMSSPPLWFLEAVGTTPDPFNMGVLSGTNVAHRLSEAFIQRQWDNYRNDPDVKAYRNTIKLDMRTGSLSQYDFFQSVLQGGGVTTIPRTGEDPDDPFNLGGSQTNIRDDDILKEAGIKK